MKLYRVYGLMRCYHYYGIPSFIPVPDVYFSSLHDALRFILLEVVGSWSIFCGIQCVAHGDMFYDSNNVLEY